jgi:hypothetical protein
MTCNKFLQNRPKKRNPMQKQPTDSPLFFFCFFFWAPLGNGKRPHAVPVITVWTVGEEKGEGAFVQSGGSGSGEQGGTRGELLR